MLGKLLRSCFCLAITALLLQIYATHPVWAQGGESTIKVSKVWDSSEQFDVPTRDSHIDARSEPGSIKLRRWDLLVDGPGEYVTGGRTETLSGTLRARKDFVIDDPNVFSAELYFFASGIPAGAEHTLWVNDKPLTYTNEGAHGYYSMQWDRVKIPVEYLKAGTNSFVFKDMSLWIEYSRQPNRSAKSEDSGVTWDYDALGPQNALDGEYIVRLGLERYAPQGEITSEYIDLASLTGSPVAPFATVKKLLLSAQTSCPSKTAVKLLTRVGSTPSFEGGHWTAWMMPADLPLNSPSAGGWRYAQWKAILTTQDPKQTPTLKSVTLEAELAAQPAANIEVTDIQNQTIIRTSYPFAYEAYVSGFANLYHTRDLIKDCKTDLERATVLAKWTRKQWEYGIDPADPIFNDCAPWDPAILIYLARQGYSPGYCVHVSLAYVGVCESVGLTARQFIRPDGCAEVWSNEAGKWVAMEVVPDPAFHYERNGIPQSGLDIHRLKAQKAGFDVLSVTEPPMSQDTPVFFGSFTKPAGKMGGFFGPGEVTGLFEGIFIPLRNNWITSNEPREAYHGVDYHEYDNYLWWAGDEAAPNVPWYSYRTDREGDFYWSLNQAELHPHAGQEPGVIEVDMATVTPTLNTFLVRVEGGEWQPVAPSALRTRNEGCATYTWKLHPGANTLEATTKNAAGFQGIVSKISLNYKP
jgi:hypothetical protein